METLVKDFPEYVQLAEDYKLYTNRNELDKILETVVGQQYRGGIILNQMDAYYHFSRGASNKYRTPNVLKYKPEIDMEAKIVPSRGRAGVYCVDGAGNKFYVIGKKFTYKKKRSNIVTVEHMGKRLVNGEIKYENAKIVGYSDRTWEETVAKERNVEVDGQGKKRKAQDMSGPAKKKQRRSDGGSDTLLGHVYAGFSRLFGRS